jgi:branched-chain amino acid transport system permease protein
VWVTLLAQLGVLLLARLYRSSRTGMRLQASREDPVAAAASGVNVRMERLGSWVLSAAVMGAGGALWAQSYLAFGPDAFYFDITFALLAMLVIGGRASVTGAVAGAALITIATDMLTRVEQGVSWGAFRIPAVPGLVRFSIALLIILALVFRPQGLFGRWELDDVVRRIRARLRERRAGRAVAAAEPVEAVEGEMAASAAASAPPAGRAAEGSPARPPEVEGTPATILSAEKISKSFEGLHALSEVSLVVGQGNVLGLIGPNGSGKTTLLNVLSGIFPPDGGRVRFLGRDVGGATPHHIARAGISRTFQNIRLFHELTVREHIEVAAVDPGGSDTRDVVSWLGLRPVLEELGGNLSYGVQRRVEIARAAVRRPSLLLLDEPAAGMNEAESDELLRDILAIRDRLGCSVVVVDHDLRLIMQLCERIHVLNEGRTVAEGAPQEIATDPAVVEAYLGRPRTEGASTDDPVEG